MGFSIAQVGPDSGRIYHGQSVTVVGSDFGSTEGTLKIDGVAQDVTAWSDTEIVFTANAPVVGGFTLTVERAG